MVADEALLGKKSLAALLGTKISASIPKVLGKLGTLVISAVLLFIVLLNALSIGFFVSDTERKPKPGLPLNFKLSPNIPLSPSNENTPNFKLTAAGEGGVKKPEIGTFCGFDGLIDEIPLNIVRLRNGKVGSL